MKEATCVKEEGPGGSKVKGVLLVNHIALPCHAANTFSSFDWRIRATLRLFFISVTRGSGFERGRWEQLHKFSSVTALLSS